MKFEPRSHAARFGIVVYHNQGEYPNFPDFVTYETNEEREDAFERILETGKYYSSRRQCDIYPVRMARFDLGRVAFQRKEGEPEITKQMNIKQIYIGE